MADRLPEPPSPRRGEGAETLFRRLRATFRSRPPWLQVTVAIVVLVIAARVFATLGDEGPHAAVQAAAGDASPEPSLEPSPSPEPSPTPSESPQTAHVPMVLGETQKAAVRTLERHGFKVLVGTEYAKGRAGVVIEQSPESGELEEGSVIHLTISEPLPTIPDVVGLRLPQARDALKDVGYRVKVRKQASTQPAGTVLSQTPAAGAEAKPGREVTLVVAKAAPAPQPPSGNCDPSYPTVCIPSPPPDLDCGEIGYTNFRVTGGDPHGFDGDNDGIGCET